MTTIYLIRHGATEWNDTRRAQGLADIDLNDNGLRQAEEAASKLADLDIEAIYSSDLKRAVDTAAPLAAHHDLDVRLDPDLREIDQGEWTGLLTSEIKERWPDLWGPARHYSARPGGESPADVRDRALKAIRRIVEAHPAGNVVVVSHGGPIRWLSAEALGLDDVGSRAVRGVSNGGIVSFDARLDGSRLVLSNVAREDGATASMADPNA